MNHAKYFLKGANCDNWGLRENGGNEGAVFISADKDQHAAQSICWMSPDKEEALGAQLVAPSWQILFN